VKKELKQAVLKLFDETKDIEVIKNQFKGQIYPDTIKRWCYPELNETAKERSRQYHNAKKDDIEYKEKRKQQSKNFRKTETYTKAWSEHYEKSKEKRKQIAKEHRLKNIETYKARTKENYLKNKEHYRQLGKEYYEKNKAKLKLLELKRYHNDPITNLKHNLRTSLNRALKYGAKKNNKALIYLGCSIQEFKDYLEKRFDEGMNWANRELWHIDHIIPLSQLQSGYTIDQLCHYTNLRPTWKTENLIKANSLILDITYGDNELQNEIIVLTNKEGSYDSVPVYNKNVLHVQKHFYDRERQLWTDNFIKEQLIENRCFYLNKQPEKLTAKNLLRGFKISGIHYGYSHFSPLWLKKFITDYNIKSVYDPCGGWGHRLLGTLGTNIEKYIYNDFDVRTCNGVKSIAEIANLQNIIEIHNNDSSLFVPNTNVDAVFTCPPYFNKETYNNKVFKNKEDFTLWWNKTVDNCLQTNCKYFAYIVDNNTAQMTEPKLQNFKLSQKTQLNSSKHHFIPDKVNYEHLYVYQTY
jgi:Uri superfamily endonuclease